MKTAEDFHYPGSVRYKASTPSSTTVEHTRSYRCRTHENADLGITKQGRPSILNSSANEDRLRQRQIKRNHPCGSAFQDLSSFRDKPISQLARFAVGKKNPVGSRFFGSPKGKSMPRSGRPSAIGVVYYQRGKKRKHCVKNMALTAGFVSFCPIHHGFERDPPVEI